MNATSPSTSRTIRKVASVAIAAAATLALAASATAATATAVRTRPIPTLIGATAPQAGGLDLTAAVAAQNTKYDGLNVFRLFYPGLPASWDKITEAVGSTPVVVSFKGSPTGVLAGQYDAQLESWFATAPTDHRIFWTYYHEPEDNIEAGQFTAAQYRDAFNHILDLQDAYGSSTKLRATQILMCWTLEKTSGRNWVDYYPGDRIKVLAWDCYNSGDKSGVYRDPAKLLADAFATASATGIPFGLAEVGSQIEPSDTDGSGRAAWLREMTSLAESHQARFITYFDNNIGTDYRLLDAPSIQEWTAEAN